MKHHITWLSLASLAASAVAAEVGNVIPMDYFGMHIHRADSTTPWPTIPFGSWRLWDAYVAWPNLEPTPTGWDFSRLDLYVEKARINKVELVLPLGLTPAWASSRPTERSSYSPGNAAPPANLTHWNNYVSTVASRYKGRIGAYEIWNEPNAGGFFSGSIEEIVQLTCSAYRRIKQEDPNALVVSPSATTQARGVAWFDQFLAAGGKGCFDIVGFHFYTLAHQPPESMIPIAQKLREVLDRHEIGNLPVWNTESGWYIKNQRAPVTVRWHVLNDGEAAAYVGRALILGRSLGFRRFFWYAWDDGNLGLMDREERSLKLAAYAYGMTARWLHDASVNSCVVMCNNIMACTLARGTSTFRIVWSLGSKQVFHIPSNWNAVEQQELLTDVPTPIAQSQLRVGSMPILLLGPER